LAQFAKEKQRVAEAATGANRPHAELARPRIIPHPEAGTIEFEHGQIVAKMGRRVGQVKEGFHPSPISFTLRGCRMMRKRSHPGQTLWHRPCRTKAEPSSCVLVEGTDEILGTARQGRLVMSKVLVFGTAALALSAGAASAQGVYPGYGYAPYGYGYYDYAATAPLYDYAAPAYAAPATTAGTTIVIVTPGPAYTAPPVGSGYYNYAPGYWGGYGRWRAGYWWR
jgi:hypothetical protein